MHDTSRHSLITGAGALVSRLLGFARDAAMAWLLGSTASADALSAALRLPYLARRLLGEGTLSMALTAACSRSPNPAALARAVTRRLACAAGLGVFAGLVWAEPLTLFLAPGLAGQANLPEAIILLRVSLPYVFFAALAAGSMATLHSRGFFGLPALTPTLFNLTVLLFALVAAVQPSKAGLWLAAGVSCGGLAQWLAQTPTVHKLRTLENAPAGSRRVSAAWRAMPAGIVGAAFPQLAFVIAAGLASLSPAGHMSALFYAERLLEFPLGIMGAAVGMAATPALARLAQSHGPDALSAEAHQTLCLTLALNLPAAAGLLAVSTPVVVLVLGHGAFDENAAHMTALALCAYTPGLPAYALSRPLLALCHAIGDTRTPLMATFTALPVTLALGTALLFIPETMENMAQAAGLAQAAGVVGPALGVSLGLYFHVFMLWWGLKKRVNLPLRNFWKQCIIYATGSVCTYGSAVGTLHATRHWSTNTEHTLALVLAVSAGVLAYGLVVGILDKGLIASLKKKF